MPTLRHAPGIAAEWLPRITAFEYDPRDVPAAQKRGCTIGMGMTEKQGGSDVRANTTRALRLADGRYELVGHKWFFSAPMCDGHLVLAKTDERGPTCFFVPRWRPDGGKNAVHIQRLKDKVGNRSNSSSEVEFENACGVRLEHFDIEAAEVVGEPCTPGHAQAIAELHERPHFARPPSPHKAEMAPMPGRE